MCLGALSAVVHNWHIVSTRLGKECSCSDDTRRARPCIDVSLFDATAHSPVVHTFKYRPDLPLHGGDIPVGCCVHRKQQRGQNCVHLLDEPGAQMMTCDGIRCLAQPVGMGRVGRRTRPLRRAAVNACPTHTHMCVCVCVCEYPLKQSVLATVLCALGLRWSTGGVCKTHACFNVCTSARVHFVHCVCVYVIAHTSRISTHAIPPACA
jgi:hypothetical protein